MIGSTIGRIDVNIVLLEIRDDLTHGIHHNVHWLLLGHIFQIAYKTIVIMVYA